MARSRSFILWGFICCLSTALHAGPSRDSLQRVMQSCLQFLVETQQKTSVEGQHYQGEWPAYMTMRTRFVLLGNQKARYDANCFALAGIVNLLSEVYLQDSQWSEIPAMLDRAIPQLLQYSDSNGFNFWPLREPQGRLSWYRTNRPNALIRQPLQYRLPNTYIRRAANVMNDNDDTSQGLLALWYYRQIRPDFVPPDYLKGIALDLWRDTLRSTLHYYNLFARDPRSSGAYLTWRGEEEPFPTWNLPRLLINNALFLTPLSTAYPTAYVPYMPYGANDVDAVVNANVLYYLSKTSTLAKGKSGAAAFITKKTRHRQWSRAGVYYPNRYHLHYATIRAWKSGINELEEASNRLIAHLKASQRADGSFESRRIVNRHDRIQSTLYAFSAMVHAGHPDQTGLRMSIEAALKFLLDKLQTHAQTHYLPGGVFFSGGTVIRNTLYWMSDAYSTAIFVKALQDWSRYADAS